MDFIWTPTHLHLLLNHFPIIGFMIGLALFFIAAVSKSEHLRVASLVVLVLISITAIPTYITGNAAGESVCGVAANLPGTCTDGTPRYLIDQHEGVALIALFWMVLTGGLSWLGLWQWRRFGHESRWIDTLIVVFGIIAVAVVSRAGQIGGEIRHPEVRAFKDPGGKAFGRIAGEFISNTPWTWVTAETLHFIGLTLLLGVLTLILLKVLGYMPTITYDTLDRLLPWAILGFGLNIVTGMAFFAAAPYQYIHNVAFYYKLAFILLAGLVTLIFTFDPSWQREGQPAPTMTKVVAGAALFFWVGVMYWGSMLPFIGNAF
jgi:hypothetical protein